MISAPIIHPIILGSLAAAGHRSTILVTDAHYAAATTVCPRSTIVHLNFTAGTPLITEVIAALLQMIPVERHTSMRGPAAHLQGVANEVNALLGPGVPHDEVEREEFYRLARSDDLALCIVTGDTRRFANALLTVGVNTSIDAASPASP
jgi:L-fucose mutarotase